MHRQTEEQENTLFLHHNSLGAGITIHTYQCSALVGRVVFCHRSHGTLSILQTAEQHNAAPWLQDVERGHALDISAVCPSHDHFCTPPNRCFTSYILEHERP